MRYEKAYIKIAGERFLDGIFDHDEYHFYPYEEFIEMMIEKDKESTDLIDHLNVKIKEQDSINMAINEKYESLLRKQQNDTDTCRAIKENMWDVIDKRFSLFADEPIFSNWGDGLNLKEMRRAIIEDLKKEGLWVD